MRKLYSRIFLGLIAVLCSYASMAQISVTATAGTTGPTAYTTLKAAFDAINAGTHQGAITISVTANTTETAKDSLVASGTGSATYTSVLIKPAAGVTATITSSAGATILLYGADNVTIDGSNTAGGTSRNLTITNTATSGVIIHVASASTSNGATNNTIKNNIIRGGTVTVVDVLAGGAGLGTDADAPNSNNTITNNAISGGQNAVYIRGNATTLDASWSITNNEIGSTNAAEKLTYRGMLLGNATNYTISGNRIFGVVSSATASVTMTGIQLALNHNTGQVFNNRISDIKHTNPQGWGSNGILLGAATTASNITVHNNFIWDVASAGYDSVGVADNGYGIIAGSGGGYNIYYNTVVLGTNQTAANGHPIAFNVTAGVTTPGSLNVRNNHFIVTSTVGTERIAIYSGAPNTVFAAIDYNNYYSSGANLGFIGTLRTNLAAIQAGFGGNTNSLNINPTFVSATDLHMAATNTSLDNKGTPIAGISTDIDADVRHATTPDIGADEFTSSSTCTNPVIGTQPTAQTVCSGANASFSVAATGTGLTYQWKLNGNNVTAGTGGTTANYTVPASAAVAGNYTVVVSSGTCSVTSNAAALTVNAATAITTQPTSVTACQGTANFTVAATGTALTYQWKLNGNNVTAGTGGTTANYSVPVTTANAGTYTVVVTGTCGAVTSNNATLTVQTCTAVPTVNADISSVVMTPTVVKDIATVRVTASKAMKLTWSIVDAQGKLVMTVNSQVVPGKNNISLNIGKLPNGTYQLKGTSPKGATSVVSFVKM